MRNEYIIRTLLSGRGHIWQQTH